MRRVEEHWTLDRRIPIAVIITLLMQMIGALIWATELDARVGAIEKQNSGMGNVIEKFARLEERLDQVKDDMGYVKRKLDYVTDRMIRK